MAVVFEPTKGLTDKPFHYCPGCCHGIIHRLVAETLVANDALETAVGVASVGCTYNSYEYIACDMVQAAHGRAPAVATGIKRNLKDSFVFTYQGDGDLASIGTAEIVITAFSTCSRISRNVIRQAAELGIKVGMIRPITLWPFPYKAIAEAADMPSVKAFLDVELNAGQMIEDVKLGVNGKKPVYFHGRLGGNLPMQKEILDKIVAIHEGKITEGGNF